MFEEWKDIKGYEGLYQVSDMGRVKSFKKEKGYILKTNGRPYPGVFLYKDSTRKRVNVHILVAEAFLDKVEGKNQINHKDANKTNNMLSNLEWSTQRENIHHAINLGLFTVAENNGMSKFSNDEVRTIRLRYKPYCQVNGANALAREYGVSTNTMHRIVRNETYTSI